MEQKNLTPGDILPIGPTADDIKLLKAKYPNQKLIQLDIPQLGKTLVLKKPDRMILAASIKIAQDGDALESTRVMAMSCTVWGDTTILEDADVLVSISPKIDQLIETYDVEVKNL
jgi:hypothetical protein